MTMKLKIDARSGLVEIEADETSFSLAAEEAKSLIAALSNWPTTEEVANTADDVRREPIATPGQVRTDPPAEGIRRRRRANGSSKVASWKMVPDLLDEEQRASLREFYTSKSPSNQNEQVAVISAKLKDLLKRESFDGHELYTAFQAVGAKTPGNLTAVLGNLATEGYGRTVDGKFEMNFKGNDLVKHNLPRKPKAK